MPGDLRHAEVDLERGQSGRLFVQWEGTRASFQQVAYESRNGCPPEIW